MSPVTTMLSVQNVPILGQPMTFEVDIHLGKIAIAGIRSMSDAVEILRILSGKRLTIMLLDEEENASVEQVAPGVIAISKPRPNVAVEEAFDDAAPLMESASEDEEDEEGEPSYEASTPAAKGVSPAEAAYIAIDRLTNNTALIDEEEWAQHRANLDMLLDQKKIKPDEWTRLAKVIDSRKKQPGLALEAPPRILAGVANPVAPPAPKPAPVVATPPPAPITEIPEVKAPVFHPVRVGVGTTVERVVDVPEYCFQKGADLKGVIGSFWSHGHKDPKKLKDTLLLLRPHLPVLTMTTSFEQRFDAILAKMSK